MARQWHYGSVAKWSPTWKHQQTATAPKGPQPSQLTCRRSPPSGFNSSFWHQQICTNPNRWASVESRKLFNIQFPPLATKWGNQIVALYDFDNSQLWPLLVHWCSAQHEEHLVAQNSTWAKLLGTCPNCQLNGNRISSRWRSGYRYCTLLSTPKRCRALDGGWWEALQLDNWHWRFVFEFYLSLVKFDKTFHHWQCFLFSYVFPENIIITYSSDISHISYQRHLV